MHHPSHSQRTNLLQLISVTKLRKLTSHYNTFSSSSPITLLLHHHHAMRIPVAEPHRHRHFPTICALRGANSRSVITFGSTPPTAPDNCDSSLYQQATSSPELLQYTRYTQWRAHHHHNKCRKRWRRLGSNHENIRRIVGFWRASRVVLRNRLVCAKEVRRQRPDMKPTGLEYTEEQRVEVCRIA